MLADMFKLLQDLHGQQFHEEKGCTEKSVLVEAGNGKMFKE
jgi:hypothetical protein